MRRASAVVTSAANPISPLADTWVSVALTYHGLNALGVPQVSLDSFAWEFRQGMAARSKELGDTGESGPEDIAPTLAKILGFDFPREQNARVLSEMLTANGERQTVNGKR